MSSSITQNSLLHISHLAPGARKGGAVRAVGEIEFGGFQYVDESRCLNPNDFCVDLSLYNVKTNPML